ncbi:MAG: NAD(P)H-binding protein [Cyclobacteriaceae bacterium]
MKITITGSLGHISKPLTKKLVQQGHTVTVVSSKPERQKEIEALGAKAAIGTMEDVQFLTKTFKNEDVVYLMEPPINFFDKSIDMIKFYTGVAENYAQAIQQSGVKRIVHLSSIGAHTDKGNGILASHYNVEQILGALPSDIAIVTLRPVGFYYNTFAFINAIKSQGAIISNYGGDDKEPWVSPIDIAEIAAAEIAKPFSGRTFQYIASDELSPNEVAKILGEAIGKPDLKWNIISDEQRLNTLLFIGMSEQAAKGLTEMDAGRRGSLLYEDYFRYRPELGKVKLNEFAKEFAAVYNSNS